MDIKQRFIHIRDFLKKYHYLWEMEIIERYPTLPQEEYTQWAQDLAHYSFDSFTELENKLNFLQAEASFQSFLKELKDLIQLPNKVPSLEESQLKPGVTLKKHHEIECVSSFLQNKSPGRALDFAGGAGHLSHCLTTKNKIQCLCLDSDRTLISKGRQVNSPLIEFRQADIIKDRKTLISMIHPGSLCLGLHSCGNLSNQVIRYFEESSATMLLNFGCCYHKVSDEYNLSQLSQGDPLPLSQHALMLATRSHTIVEPKDLIRREKVKRYRYSLHMLTQDHQLAPHFITLGNAHPTEYELSFAEYANIQFQKVGIEHTFCEEFLNQYFEEKSHEVCFYIRLSLIRNLLGRALELYIILDRAIYLQEKKYNVEVFELFKRELSPRNIGIFATKLSS